MKNKVSLKIQMVNPCEEEWNSMTQVEHGRFCNLCNKAVIDFTRFSKSELADYFLKNPFPVCGRIHEFQSNVEIPIETKRQLKNFQLQKVAATAMTIFSLGGNGGAHASNHLNARIENGSSFFKNQYSGKQNDTIVITGKVTNDLNEPLSNATVQFENKEYKTNLNGEFSFIVESEDLVESKLYFGYGDLVPEVRNYHPAMHSTNYDVKLYRRYAGHRIIAGGIAPSFYIPDGVPSFVKMSSFNLNKSVKLTLKSFSEVLKNNPMMNVSLQTFYKTDKKTPAKKAERIKAYFVNTLGISVDRFTIPPPIQIGDKNQEFIIRFTEAD